MPCWSLSIIYRFMIGATSNKTIRESNHQEMQQFNDLIISSLRDSYLNLTLKTFSILQWQQFYCPSVEYLLKTDDDTVVDVGRLQYWIEKDFKYASKKGDQKVIFGKVWSKVSPRRNPKKKWYTSYQAWKQRYFPAYCNGPTYLLASKAAELILDQSPFHYMITIEDLFVTGILAEAAGVKRIDKWKNFGIDWRSGCDEKGMPYLTSVYGIGDEGIKFEEGVENSFSEATDRLARFNCTTRKK